MSNSRIWQAIGRSREGQGDTRNENPTDKNRIETDITVGFLSYFRAHIANFAEIAKLLTDLTARRVSTRIPWGLEQQKAFDEFKRLLCKVTVEPLCIVDLTKPFDSYVDASAHSVSAVLTQKDPDGREVPVAFSSTKLTATQRAWSTIEREAYAALVALQKYRCWIFGSSVVVHSDHNPLLYLTETAPKSSKLMRWSLSL